jgi:DNA-binding transcriptional MocR family regulator
VPDLDLAIQSAEGGPVYQQIADGIRRAIEQGRLSIGARLPAIRRLATDLDVNRDTVALAYEALAVEGLLESTVGRGTFVLRPPGRVPEEPAQLELSVEIERLLAIGDARTRFGAAPNAVPLHSLVPDPALYPVADFRRALNRALAKGGAELFLYGSAQGHAGLRDVLAARFAGAGMDVKAEDIVLCHGASQGISLALRLFASAGERVAVESPTYPNVLATLAGLGMRPVAVEMSSQGPDLDALERVLALPDVKAFYTIPTFHNPMGITTSASHRRALLEVARRCGKPIVEDAFEMDLRSSGRAVPTLAALDRYGLVVHLYSFSKSLFPGLRIGSIAAPSAGPRAVDALVALKQSTDLSDSMPLQAALAEFLEEGAYDRHLGRIRRELRMRHQALQEALEEHLPEGTHWTRPEGGYQVWVELPVALDTRDLVADAARLGVLFLPGAQFLHDGAASRCLRLTLAQAGPEQIERGIEALGRAVAGGISDRAGTVSAPGIHL